MLKFLLEKEIFKLSSIPDTSYSWMQIVNGFHGKNIVKDDQRISEENYSDGIDEGQTQINIVKHSQVQDVSEIFKAA